MRSPDMRNSNELRRDSCSAISDHLKHNQTTVHYILTKLLSLICNNLTRITSIKYFTDGTASQYKSFKTLISVAFNFHDHKLTAEHNFCATYGKSPYDGIGGTIKRAPNTNLRATIDIQIVTTEDLYWWAKE